VGGQILAVGRDLWMFLASKSRCHGAERLVSAGVVVDWPWFRWMDEQIEVSLWWAWVL
jgi:hypothetical protein